MNRTKRPKINEIFAAWSTGYGFFTNLYNYMLDNNIEPPEWISNAQIAEYLDIKYHTSYGEKSCTNFVLYYVTDGYITNNNLKKISGIWYTLHRATIDRMWADYNEQYNPIENYSMTESGTDTKTGTDTVTISGEVENSQTGTQRLQGDTTATGNIYGYNSASAVPSDKTETDTDTTRTDNLTNTTVYNNRNDETQYNTENAHELTRSGNIGVTTTQQMLQSDIELWKWHFYETYLFQSVNTILALPIYRY